LLAKPFFLLDLCSCFKIAAGKELNELQFALELDQFRREQNLSRGPSFPTIAGFGPNGASPHYSPSDSSNVLKIDGSSTLVLDSGGHYLGKNNYSDTFLI
jgi:Xaa-Pro aminopeptidase